MADKQIFREAALERLSTPDRLDQGLTIVGSAEWIGLGALVALILGGAVWGATIDVPITVGGSGILLAPGGLLEVTSGSRGRVVNFSIAPGDQVKAGQEVARLDQSEIVAQLATAKAELRDLQAEHDQIVAFQARKRPTLAAASQQKRQGFEDHVKFLTERLNQLTERDKANRDLLSKGYTSAQKVLDTQLEIGQADEQRQRDVNGLRELDLDETKQRVADEQELMQSELKVSSAQRKVENLEEQLARETSVTSPYAGRVVELKVKLGEIVERGASMFTVIPTEAADKAVAASAGEQLTAVIYVPSGEGKQIKVGMPVALSPSVAPREEYGFLMGKVRWVAEVPSTPEGMTYTLKNKQLVTTLSNNAAPIEVAVDLERDPSTPSGYKWSSSRGPDLKLNDGTLARADIQVRELPLLSLVIPPLRQVLTPKS
ncbi:MAG TPA: NHLP bacteriocin system secretion protein [Pseudolabrys sp.]|nr:NHLP bacteriocin system secretion protein [Pseudolabrys sp.]